MPVAAQSTDIKWNGTTIPYVTSFTGFGVTHAMLDDTDLSDTLAQRIASGIGDSGEMTLELNWDPNNAVHNALVNDMVAGTSRALILQVPNAAAGTNTWSATSFCSAFTPTGSRGEQLTASVTIEATSTLTLA